MTSYEFLLHYTHYTSTITVFLVGVLKCLNKHAPLSFPRLYHYLTVQMDRPFFTIYSYSTRKLPLNFISHFHLDFNLVLSTPPYSTVMEAFSVLFFVHDCSLIFLCKFSVSVLPLSINHL